MDDMIKLRDTLRSAADIIDEFISLKSKENNGDDVSQECESVLGRFFLKMAELQAMSS